MDLQDHTKYTMANGLYIDGNGNAVIELVQIARNADFQYSCDPASNCQQLYTVIYLPKKLVASLNTLTFAINSSSLSG